MALGMDKRKWWRWGTAHHSVPQTEGARVCFCGLFSKQLLYGSSGRKVLARQELAASHNTSVCVI